jgi:hypothetical protein
VKKILLTISSLVVTFSSAQAWNISGNNGTNPSTDFLGTIDAQPLIFKTNNSEKARITLNGNVGIGTTNPQAKLDVNGDIHLQGLGKIYGWNDPANYYIGKYSVTGSSGLDIHWYGGIKFGTAGGDAMQLLSNGNVGIGTTNPQSKLDVNGDVHLQGLGKIYGWNDPANYYIGKYSVTGSSGLDIHWHGGIKFGTAGGDAMQLLSNGNVGIGTTNPQAKLDVNGEARILHGLDIYDESVNGSNLRISGNGGYIPAGITFTDTSYNQAGQVARWSIWKGNTWGKGLGFMRYDAVSPCGTGICDVPFFLADTGNVGINNTSPAAKLDVNGDVRIANIPASTSSTDQPLVIDAQGFVKKGSAANGNMPLSEKQIVNARATGYAIIAAKNPGINFPVFVIPWDGVNTLEYNANNQIDPSWHPQVVIKGNYFNQPFDGSDFSIYSSFVTSQSDFDLYKSTGTQWWIVCSTLPSFSKSITSNESTGNVAITNKLEAKEIKVTLTPTADFVFEKDYGLPKLEEVEKFIKENKHLPEIASAKEMEKEGVNIGEFQIKLLQKIEELTLYSIDLNKKNKEQEVLIKSQADILKSLHERLEKIEKVKQK